MTGLPWHIVVPLAALLLCYLGMLLCFSETRAVQAMRPWPFRSGVAAARLAAPVVTFATGRTGVVDGVQYRVLSPGECIFVEEGWRSVLSWTRDVSPFRLKGHATSDRDGVHVVGRISLGACIALPAFALWMGGCGILGMATAPAFSAIIVVVGLGLPTFGAWYSLPKEIAAFRARWASVEAALRS